MNGTFLHGRPPAHADIHWAFFEVFVVLLYFVPPCRLPRQFPPSHSNRSYATDTSYFAGRAPLRTRSRKAREAWLSVRAAGYTRWIFLSTSSSVTLISRSVP
jgi:hypothetical protein